MGHYNYWHLEDITYTPDDVPSVPERIKELYRWHKGNRPYSTPKAKGSRAVPSVSQIRQIRDEHVQRSEKENRKKSAAAYKKYTAEKPKAQDKGKEKTKETKAKEKATQSKETKELMNRSKEAEENPAKKAKTDTGWRPKPKIMGIARPIIDALEEAVDTINGGFMHPLRPLQGDKAFNEGVEEWFRLCGSKTQRKQVPRIGMDAQTAEELYYKYGHKGSPFEKRKSLFQFLYILKHKTRL